MQSASGDNRLLVRQMAWEADGILSVVLTHPEGDELDRWDLGAHIDVILTPDIIRQYSLCGNPGSRDEWKIAVLREPHSLGGSEYIHDVLRPGMIVNVAGPRNNFPLVEADHYLLIAGGIGVAPIVPMALWLAESNSDWHLLYGGRRRASMAFCGMLSALGHRVSIAPEDEFGLLDLKSAIEATPLHTAIYCCGPEPLIAAVEAQCEASARPSPHIERFQARPGRLLELEAMAAGDEEFELVLAKSGKRLTIPRDKTIIQVLDENRVYVPTSCTEGYCGMCETEVVSGIPDHRDDFLTAETRASNKTMMVCCGRSKTPELVINL